MKTSIKRIIVFSVSGVLAAGLLSGCGSLDGTKTVATVNGTNIPLGIVSLDARRSQAETENIYRQYFGVTGGIWDSSEGDENGQTYGQSAVQSALEEVELLYLLKEKAPDYGVELTQEDLDAITEAAKAFMEANSKETIKELGVDQSMVETYLDLQTIQSRMREPIKNEATIDIDEAAAQQSSYTYVLLPFEDLTEEEEAEEDVVSEEEAAEEEAVSEEEAAEEEAVSEEEAAEEEAVSEEKAPEEEAVSEEEAPAEEEGTTGEDAAEEEGTTGEDAAEEEAKAKLFQEANQLLGALKVNADSDWNEAAAAIEASLMSEEDHFTTVDSDEEWLANEQPQALLDVLRTLSDGELYDGIVETDDGYYVVRLDHVNDEEATQEIIDEETEARKNDYYEEATDAMLTSADIKVNDKVLSDLKITDKHTFTLVSSEGSTDEAGEVVEAETEAVSETAAEAASEAETEAAGETETEAAEAETEAAGETETEAAEAETEAATENKDEAKKDAAEETVTTEAVTEKEK